MLNTLKTLLGFILSVLEKYTPLRLSGNTLENTYNYLKISDQLATSGQPTEAQFQLIQAAGYQTVINLAPVSVLENSLKAMGIFILIAGYGFWRQRQQQKQ